MKRFLLILALLLPLPLLAQPAIDSSQIKLKTNGGLGGDAAQALGTQIYRNTSAPSSPATGQLWCDTTTTPCILKIYNGSTWVAPQQSASLATQADVSTFPGTPTDGQIFFSKSPYGIYIYDATAAKWVSLRSDGNQANANIVDVYSAAVITPPTAPTAATSGTAGSTSAGNYSYCVTFRNVNGGETTCSPASNSVAPGASKSNDLSSIPTGGTGTTNRNIYRSKANQDVSGPWYFVGNIADNSTTTYHDGAADASLLLLAPDVNFSAPLPGAWIVINNSANTTTGGCGGTGGARATMACYAGQTGYVYDSGISSDLAVHANVDLAGYVSGNFTMQYRVKLLSIDGDSFPGGVDAAFMGVRAGTADNAIRHFYYVGQGGTTTMPFSSTVHGQFKVCARNSIGAASSSYMNAGNPFPMISAFPFWVRVIKRGNYTLGFVSSNGLDWTARFVGFTTSNTDNLTSDGTLFSATFNAEIPVGFHGTPTAANQGWIEIDHFTVTVDP